MLTNPRIRDYTKKFEGLRLKAYQDSKGLWTIGYGHLLGKVKTIQEVTKEQANQFLDHDLETAEHFVFKYVTNPLDTHQIGALTDFTFNLGPGNLKRSTLVKLLNTGNVGAAEEVPKWVFAVIRNEAGNITNRIILKGLVIRRHCELALFKGKYELADAVWARDEHKVLMMTNEFWPRRKQLITALLETS